MWGNLVKRENCFGGGNMLTQYIEVAMKRAKVKPFSDDTWYAHIPECPGVWANEETYNDALKILREVLEEWIMLGLMNNDSFPIIDDIEIGKIVEYKKVE